MQYHFIFENDIEDLLSCFKDILVAYFGLKKGYKNYDFIFSKSKVLKGEKVDRVLMALIGSGKSRMTGCQISLSLSIFPKKKNTRDKSK